MANDNDWCPVYPRFGGEELNVEEENYNTKENISINMNNTTPEKTPEKTEKISEKKNESFFTKYKKIIIIMSIITIIIIIIFYLFSTKTSNLAVNDGDLSKDKSEKINNNELIKLRKKRKEYQNEQNNTNNVEKTEYSMSAFNNMDYNNIDYNNVPTTSIIVGSIRIIDDDIESNKADIVRKNKIEEIDEDGPKIEEIDEDGSKKENINNVLESMIESNH